MSLYLIWLFSLILRVFYLGTRPPNTSCEGEIRRMISAWASFCFWRKALTGLEFGLPSGWVRAINNAQEVLLNEDCLHKEGPLMVIGLIEKSECGGFVRHRKWGLSRKRKWKRVHRKGQAKMVIEIGRLEIITASGMATIRGWQAYIQCVNVKPKSRTREWLALTAQRENNENGNDWQVGPADTTMIDR